MSLLTCFKAYDIRGQLGDELNADIAYRIGRAYALHLHAKRVVIGGDIRLSTAEIKDALARGLIDQGCDVIDIGMTGTEEVYFAAFHLGVDGGIEVTASHNPSNYNGMKMVRRGAQPISNDSGLLDIKQLAEANVFATSENKGKRSSLSILDAYIDHLLSYIDLKLLPASTLVVNAGNGAAGHVIDAIEQRFLAQQIPVRFIKVHHEADGTFPHGIPNPLLPENRADTANAVKQYRAQMGIAWDGDFDRCFLFDENGEFIEGYYIVGLLAQAFLAQHPGAKVIHDPRLTWNSIEIIEQAGGQAILSKTGHAFIKERMRQENAVYGGEMSAHHYFRDFAYCDSGMIPWLLVLQLLAVTGKPLSELVAERIARFPSPGEINSHVSDSKATIARIRACYQNEAIAISELDGISMEFSDWRFNLRGSNTEPVLRLNLETRGDVHLMREKTEELLALIRQS